MTHRQLQLQFWNVFHRLIELGLVNKNTNYENIFLALNRKIELLARAEEADAKRKKS